MRTLILSAWDEVQRAVSYVTAREGRCVVLVDTVSGGWIVRYTIGEAK